MPDIDSISPSYSPSRVYSNGTSSANESHHTPSPRASTSSLAAAATMNAGFQHEDSRRSSTSSNRARPAGPQQVGRSERERRRSSVFLSSYDPTLPGPGELQTGDLRGQSYSSFPFRTASPQAMGSPILSSQRDRAPSLGELHQELEQEQEAQVNRLLEMIRHQQAQLQAIQSQVNSTPLGSSAAVADTTPPSGRFTAPTNPTLPPNLPTSNPPPSSPFRSSLELSRQSSRRSRTPSRTASPSLRPVSAGIQAQGEDWFSVGRRQSMSDEGAFYQAETQMLTRENQMLRQRIRELERQLSESNSAATNSPSTPSNLTAPPLEAGSREAILENQANKSEEKE